jgi:hypothetical protein
MHLGCIVCIRKWRHSFKFEAIPGLAAIEQCRHIIDGLSSPTRLVARSGRCCVAAAVGDKSDGFFSLAVFFFLLLDIFVGSCIKPSRNDLVPKTSHFRHLLLPIPHTVVGGVTGAKAWLASRRLIPPHPQSSSSNGVFKRRPVIIGPSLRRTILNLRCSRLRRTLSCCATIVMPIALHQLAYAS